MNDEFMTNLTQNSKVIGLRWKKTFRFKLSDRTSRKCAPHLPVPYKHMEPGVDGFPIYLKPGVDFLPDILATWGLGSKSIGNWKIRVHEQKFPQIPILSRTK